MRDAHDLSNTQRSSDAQNNDEVTLIGLDFGSTTSGALVARARIARHPVSGKIALTEPRTVFRSDPEFTPFIGESIDERTLLQMLDRWLADSRIAIDTLFAGGTIITGLAAQRDNARNIAQMVRSRLGETLVATADDPRLESWLAFMGSCATLSRFHKTRTFINLDIGGGTTNPAWGINGEVLETGCYFIGARHFEFEPGTYRLRRLSVFAQELLRHLRVNATLGDTLTPRTVDAILNYYVRALEAIVHNDHAFFADSIGREHIQAAPMGSFSNETIVVFSGGVGEIIYRLHRDVDAAYKTTEYGDLGIDLARRILATASLSRDLARYVPEQLGRATVYGLALHSTEVSGRSVFLSRENMLPLNDVRIAARLALTATHAEIDRALAAAARLSAGACIQLLATPGNGATVDQVKGFARYLGLQWHRHAPSQPLLLLTPNNEGKTIGSYATQWRTLPIHLLVIDEVADRQAQFVNVGKPKGDIIPVSFYGIS